MPKIRVRTRWWSSLGGRRLLSVPLISSTSMMWWRRLVTVSSVSLVVCRNGSVGLTMRLSMVHRDGEEEEELSGWGGECPGQSLRPAVIM
jgi:hypothetical protein